MLSAHMAKPVALYFLFSLLFLPCILSLFLPNIRSSARMSAATELDDRYNRQTKRQMLRELPTTAALKPTNANMASVDLRSSHPRFQILPKGAPIPPSGPSKGHNGINSTGAGLDSGSESP